MNVLIDSDYIVNLMKKVRTIKNVGKTKISQIPSVINGLPKIIVNTYDVKLGAGFTVKITIGSGRGYIYWGDGVRTEFSSGGTYSHKFYEGYSHTYVYETVMKVYFYGNGVVTDAPHIYASDGTDIFI